MKKFLVAIDGSEISERVIAKAVERAKNENGKLIILYVVEDFCPVGLTEIDCNVVMEILTKEGEVVINSALDRVKNSGVEFQTVTRQGRPADEIVTVAKEEKVDEIFIGSHGRHGAKKLVMGSVSSRVVEYAPCPVTVIK